MKRLAVLLLAVLAWGTARADDASCRFWAHFLRRPAKPALWKASPNDPPSVTDAKAELRRGLGPVLARARWLGRKGVRFRPVDRVDVSRIIVARYTLGKQQYVGLILPTGSARVRVVLPTGGFLYDHQHRSFVGKGAIRGAHLREGEPFFFVCYPYKVVGLSLEAKPARLKPGETLTVQARLGTSKPSGFHLFRLRVIGPEQAPREVVNRLVPAPKGRATVELPLAKDLPPGKYSVSARCVLTAAIAAETVTLQAPPAASAPGGRRP